MKQTHKLLAALLVLALGLAGCGPQLTPYEVNDQEGFTVSVKYDANGGMFTTNTSVIVDSFNVKDVAGTGAGIALLPPDAAARGNDAFKASRNGYFLAGWYRERVEVEGGEPTYKNKWDFERDRLSVDAGGTYSAENPQMTLYAAWVPLFQVSFYNRDTGELLESISYDPTETGELQIPAWNTDTGKLDMFDFPGREGFTFHKVSYDEAGEQPVEGATLPLPDTVDYETGTAAERELKLYVDWDAGEWYRIYTAEQFAKNASVSGCYEICADLDFAEAVWPTSLMYGTFTGQIRGNGHRWQNVTATQTNNSKIHAGLFGSLGEGAVLEDLTLENACFTLKAGTRMVDSSFGLLAGHIASEATLSGVHIQKGVLQIDSACYFGVSETEYAIGLLCGTGNFEAVDTADITCRVVGDNPDMWVPHINGNAVTLVEQTISE